LLRQFLHDALTYGLTTILTKGLALLLLPLLTRYLAPADFGLADTFLAVGAVANVLLCAEINQAIARFLPEAMGAEERSDLCSANWAFVCAMYGMFSLVVWCLAYPIWRGLFGSMPFDAVIFSSGLAYVVFNWLFYAATEQLRWSLEARWYAKVQVVTAVVGAVAVVCLVVFERWGITGFFTGQALGYVAGISAAWYSQRATWHFVWKPLVLRRLLHFSLPLVVPALIAVSAIYTDRFTINYMLGQSALGVYGVAMRIGLVVTLLLSIFQAPLMPLIYKHHAEHDTPGKIRQLFIIFTATLSIVLVGLAVFSAEIVSLITTPAFYESQYILAWVALKIILTQVYVFTPGLGIAKKTLHILYVYLFYFILNILLYLVLTPIFGLVGTAIAGATGGLAFILLYGWWSQRYYPLPYPLGFIATLAVLTIGCIIFSPLLWPESGFSWPVFTTKLIFLIFFSGFTGWICVKTQS
jgi:O-antigen/teichoic acid export membrane protein